MRRPAASIEQPLPGQRWETRNLSTGRREVVTVAAVDRPLLGGDDPATTIVRVVVTHLGGELGEAPREEQRSDPIRKTFTLVGFRRRGYRPLAV